MTELQTIKLKSTPTSSSLTKLSSETVKEFTKTFRDTEFVNIESIVEIDSAGLQGLLALKKHGVGFISISESLQEKLKHAGALEYITALRTTQD
jgi:hypothetical protein